MTPQLVADLDVRPLPDVALLPPQGAERITPLVKAFGLESNPEPSFLRQARVLADAHPDAPTAWVRLAQAAQAAGDDQLAVEAATRALHAGQGSSLGFAAAYVAANVLARSDHENSDALFEGLAHPMAQVARAGIAAQAGDYPEALRRLEGLPGPAAGSVRGYCLVVVGEYARAVGEYRAVRKSGRDSLDVLINLGVALARLGLVDKAIRVTQQATRRAPANATASYNLTRYYLRQGAPGAAVRELDRLSAARRSDYKATLYRAWAHATNLHDRKTALYILGTARSLFARSGHDLARAEIAASIAYLRYQGREITQLRAKRALWSALRLSEPTSPEIVSMLAAILDRRTDRRELELLSDEAGDALPAAERQLLDARRLLLEGEIEMATLASLRASELDIDAVTNARGTAAYLVGEGEGDYARAAEIAGEAFRLNPDELIANNYAFSLALSGRGSEALRILAKFDPAFLPYHGATVGLAQMALGDIAAGIESYGNAERLLRDEGDDITADFVATRGRLALRQFGVAHPDSSSERILAGWPADPEDPREPVMRRVAERVGVHL